MSTALTYAPRLETERLVLRGPEKSDLAPFTAFLTASPRMKAQGEQATVAEAWFAFMTGIGHWQWHGFGFFTLTLKDKNATAVGRAGLLRHAQWPQEELAWHLFDGAEGKGYATEAAKAVRAWAHDTLGLQKLVSYIHRDNRRSQRVAERLGATTDGTAPPHEPDAEIWTHPSPVTT
ncbi:GNAT family N-acetyltransferase [uncultured Roseobacter sp.]|uniref:GNAT family N-acetyltransferase n=1 Tax=uncultured Roseobacter sp. TaxID=114847 RepID=UPI00261037D8|nr:GNAT family N-acetyltransferase [uncultured Roseobacter sp.]